MEPWSIVAEDPKTGEPFGLVLQHDADIDLAEHIARNLLATFRLTGAYIPTSGTRSLEGHYLFLYTVSPEPIARLASIWAASCSDAEDKLNILAADGTLFMPASG
jgi:hypothetical protein